ncbi:MAG: DUF1624 domain-containing protein [Bacteroidia bacterium]|nr:DUF1624 domain-containing protein [Bacteroidia bacterium]
MNEAQFSTIKSARITSLDFIRGLVMILMALDHTRDYFYQGTFFVDPLDLSTTTPWLYATRWITHLCAPTFVFLAGTSAFLYGARQTRLAALSRFLWTRGLWLIFLELTIITFGWWFDVQYRLFLIQVIWAIGWSMLLMSRIIYLPLSWIRLLGLVIVFGHNLLDPIHFEATGLRWLWAFLHQADFLMWGEHAFMTRYPLIPWLGLMMLGYSLGSLYTAEVDANYRRRTLLRLGLAALVLFVILRGANIYGDPNPWTLQASGLKSLMSFLNVEKYPPSLQYALVTLGIALLGLAASEKVSLRGWAAPAIIFGRVPLFFYLLHIYLIHTLALGAVVLAGYPAETMIITPATFMSKAPLMAKFGYSLGITYSVWLLVLVILFPLCRMYMRYKARRTEAGWLKYL